MSDEMKSGELAMLAAIVAGPNASDDAIAANFARASLLLLKADEWLHDPEKRETETCDYILALAARADASGPKLLWSDPLLQKISGYDAAHPKRSADERGKLLFDAVDKAMGRKFGSKAVEALRERFRSGIEENLFRELWPKLSKWRLKDGTTGHVGVESPDS